MPFNLPEPYLTAAEQQLNATLPSSYRNAMLQENGGEKVTTDDTWSLYPIADLSDRKRITRTCNHILKETQNCRQWANFPGNAIAIAGNGSGDHLVLLQDGTSFSPEVFAWSHETGKLTKITNDFSELESP